MATKAQNLALLGGNVDASGEVDSNTVDGIDSSQFLRSDADDTMAGLLTVSKTTGYALYVAAADPTQSPTGNSIAVFRDNNTSSADATGSGSIGITSSPGYDVYLGKRWNLSLGQTFGTIGNGSAEHLSVNMYTGKLGIGQTNPTGQLHIKDVGTETQFKIESDSDQRSTIYFVEGTSGFNGSIAYDNTTDSMLFYVAGNGTTPAISIDPSSDDLTVNSNINLTGAIRGGRNEGAVDDLTRYGIAAGGSADFYNTYTSGNGDQAGLGFIQGQFINSPVIYMYGTTETYGNSFSVGKLTSTGSNPGSSAFANLFNVQSNGNIGIGINEPTAKLHIASGNNAFKWSEGPNSISQIEMYDTEASPVFIQAWSSSLRVAVGTYDNPAIEVANDKQTYFYGQSIKIPVGTTAQRPSGAVGKFRYNSSLDMPEYANNANAWVPMNIPGLTAGNPAPSAAYLYENGFITSGKGMYWIDTPNGGVKQVFCDFDTLDENGNSGWMLVGTFVTDYDWTNGCTTTRDAVTDSFSGNIVSANFGDHEVSMFRVTANGTINTSLGSSAAADWYYYLSGGSTWKSWWAPSSGYSYWNGQSYPIYATDGTIRGRQALIKFTHARNIKYSYTQTNQIANALSDASVDTSGYYAGGSSSQYWEALTAPGYFSVRYQAVNSSGGVSSDGTLGILPQGTTGYPNGTGQDIMNGNCKVGYDDNAAAAWYGQTATETFGATQTPGTRNTTSLFWWIK